MPLCPMPPRAPARWAALASAGSIVWLFSRRLVGEVYHYFFALLSVSGLEGFIFMMIK